MSILLNNPGLVAFLESIGQAENSSASPSLPSRDVVTWELFRQILSPFLEPISGPVAETLAECLENRSDEIEALKRQCGRLTDELGKFATLTEMSSEAERYIDLYVNNEISDLLRIGHTSISETIRETLSDKMAWGATLAYIYGLIHSAPPIVSAGGAIGLLAYLGSSSAGTIADYRRNIRSSDYRLIYRLRN
jgi:VIT1/CCC1 family predicted Fe2+/Mn2+ transporter